MSIVKIAIAFLLFIAISDKGLLQNMLTSLQNMTSPSTFSIESMITNMMNLSRIAMLDYSITMGIGYVFVELAVFAATAFAVLALITFFISDGNVVETRLAHPVEQKVMSTNDIYLQTSKFIC